MSALVIFDPIDSEKSNYLILRKLIRDMKMESNLIISIPNVKRKNKAKPTILVKKVLSSEGLMMSALGFICSSHSSQCIAIS